MWGHGDTNNQLATDTGEDGQKVVRRLWCHQIAVMAGSAQWALVTISPVCYSRHICYVPSDAAPVHNVHCAQLESVRTHSHRCYIGCYHVIVTTATGSSRDLQIKGFIGRGCKLSRLQVQSNIQGDLTILS